MRLARVVSVLPTSVTWASAAAAVALAARKVAPTQVSERAAVMALALTAGALLVAIAVAALRRLPPHAGALALDRHHGLKGRLPNAFEFLRIPAVERSPMILAALDDACRSVERGLSPREAVPIPVPSELGVGLCAALGLAAVAALEVRRPAPVEPAVAEVSSVERVEVNEDDLDLFREAMQAAEWKSDSAELREAVDEFNRLIEDLSARRLSRDEAFRRMHELEARLSKGQKEEQDAVKRVLDELSKELSKSELTKPSADALGRHDFAAARDEVRKLAERLTSKLKPSKAELERLRKALERASKSNETALARIEEQRAELKKSLLKAKEQLDKSPTDARQKSLLKKKERELERLDRDTSRRQSAGRRLSRLERQLGKAAADLLRDLDVSAEALEDMAEDLNRMEREELTDKEKEDLRQRLQELREMLRQQGQGGDKLKQRLQRFMRQARGTGGRGQGGKDGKKGQGGGGEEGDDGDLRRGGGRAERPGEGDGPGEGKGLRLGRGGKAIPVEVAGGRGGSQGDGRGEGEKPGGSDAGHGSASKLGQSTDIDGGTVDVRAEALDSGKGPTNAEVIYGAGGRGFAGRAYRNVFKQYQTVAEDQVEREKIPDGMRFYVRRYFQLIRPRE